MLMGKWNDTDEPLAYLITFRIYGSWLAGDERGSIDKYHNTYGGPRAVPSEKRQEIHARRLKSPPFLLNAAATASRCRTRAKKSLCLTHWEP